MAIYDPEGERDRLREINKELVEALTALVEAEEAAYERVNIQCVRAYQVLAKATQEAA